MEDYLNEGDIDEVDIINREISDDYCDDGDDYYDTDDFLGDDEISDELECLFEIAVDFSDCR